MCYRSALQRDLGKAAISFHVEGLDVLFFRSNCTSSLQLYVVQGKGSSLTMATFGTEGTVALPPRVHGLSLSRSTLLGSERGHYTTRASRLTTQHCATSD